jgi:hypothetical protein
MFQEMHKICDLCYTNLDFSYNKTLLKNIGDTIGINNDPDFSSSSPSIVLDNDKNITICTRFVNYRLTNDFVFEYKGDMSNNIVTRNIISVFDISDIEKWRKMDEFELEYNTKYNGLFIGIEDIRLYITNKNVLVFNGNRGTTKIHGDYGIMTVEHGKIDIPNRKTLETKLLLKVDNLEGEQGIQILKKEKNWVLFSDLYGNTRMVYNWFPLQIGSPKENDFNMNLTLKNDDGEQEQYHSDELAFLNIDKKSKTPDFFKYVRGSSNGILIGNEIWFICHYVRYEMGFDYGHVFVVLDANSLELKWYSKLFTFEGYRIEFTLGFIYIREQNSFLIGYSKFDRDTSYIVLEKTNIELNIF